MNMAEYTSSATLPLHTSALFRPVKKHQKVFYVKMYTGLKKSQLVTNMSYASLQKKSNYRF